MKDYNHSSKLSGTHKTCTADLSNCQPMTNTGVTETADPQKIVRLGIFGRWGFVRAPCPFCVETIITFRERK